MSTMPTLVRNIQSAMHTDMTPVPSKGTGPAMTDLIGGQIDPMCDQTTNTTSMIEGKVKAYAVTTPRRLTTPTLKELPTGQEAGLKTFEVTIWHGLYAPKGTPADVQKKLNDAMKVALKFVAAEIAKCSPIIKAAGVYAD